MRGTEKSRVFMRLGLLLLALFATCSSLAQNNAGNTPPGNTRLKFIGTILKVEAKPNDVSANMIDLDLLVNFDIGNGSSGAVILPTDKVTCNYVTFTSAGGEKLGKIAMFQSSTYMTWKKVAKTFDKRRPPGKRTTTIKKGEAFGFSTIFNLEIARDESKPIPIIPYPENLTFNNLKAIGPVTVRFECSTVLSGVLREYQDYDINQFWDKLRVRWVKYGFLLTDAITSEPVELDLRNIGFVARAGSFADFRVAGQK